MTVPRQLSDLDSKPTLSLGSKLRAPSVVALTGASGLMGRSLTPLLEQAGLCLRLLARRPMAPVRNVTVIEGDLADAAALRSLVTGVDALVHLAGVAHTALRTPEEHAHACVVNVEGTRHLLATARKAGVPRVILLSSAHVYAGQRGVDLRETSPTAPDSPYGSMKLEAEQAAHELSRPGFAVVILRPCLTYGPGVRFNLHALLSALRRGYYVHPAGADALRSFASVDTVAAAILHLLAFSEPGGFYNVADREPVSLRAWVDALADRMNVPRPRRVPLPALQLIAAAGSAVHRMGLPAPLTLASLNKLTASFSLNVNKLAATGFSWPSTTEQVLDRMVADHQAGQPR